MNRPDDMPMLAGVVGTVGKPEFPDSFLGALMHLCGARLFSAFSRSASDGPRTLFAEGECRGIPDFARVASHAYTSRFWRQDHAVRPSSLNRGILLVRTRAGDIADDDYRHTCYSRGGIAERLSILSAGPRPLVASAYRAAGDGPFQPADIARLEGMAPVLMAALIRHVDLSTCQLDADDPAEVTRILLAADAGLSQREAEVAAGLIQGQTQGEIGAVTGLTLSSIITYRRRAYCKLGVMDKRDLIEAYRQLRSAASPTAWR